MSLRLFNQHKMSTDQPPASSTLGYQPNADIEKITEKALDMEKNGIVAEVYDVEDDSDVGTSSRCTLNTIRKF